MDARELRIGNYVKEKNGVFQVSGVKDKTVWYKPFLTNTVFVEMIDVLEPIPLTEQWLLKFGFKDEGDGYFSKWNGDYDYSISLIGGFSYGQCADYSHPIKLKYVHQLQNLYFALTNQELTPKTK